MANEFDDFRQIISTLTRKMGTGLPGWEAQRKMASIRRLERGEFQFDPDKVKTACVLVLLYPKQGRAFTAFIRRNEYEGIHSGQISFPGGQEELPDRNHEDTALREAWEETGIEPGRVKVLGELSKLYIPPSNFMVYPVLGYAEERPVFVADPSEVQEIIEVDVESLQDPANQKEVEIRLPDGLVLSAPAYQINGNIIWGATAMMLSEMLALI